MLDICDFIDSLGPENQVLRFLNFLCGRILLMNKPYPHIVLSTPITTSHQVDFNLSYEVFGFLSV